MIILTQFELPILTQNLITSCSLFYIRFVLINAGVLFVYFTNFQKIDDEEYGGPMELTKEGFFTSFSLFLVCGIN